MTSRQGLRAEVQSMFLERLTEGRWRPGERLSIDGLAREFEVSPTPVREALASLEQSGLIEYQPLRGYLVAPPLTPEQIGQLIDARQVVEGAALTRAFARWEALVPDLRDSHATHLAAVRALRGDHDPDADPDPHSDYRSVLDYFTADAEFHGAFLRHANNHYLSEMRTSLGWDAHRMRQTWSEGAEHVDAEEALAEHAQILARVEERNHDGALRALHQHLENVRDRSGGLRPV